MAEWPDGPVINLAAGNYEPLPISAMPHFLFFPDSHKVFNFIS